MQSSQAAWGASGGLPVVPAVKMRGQAGTLRRGQTGILLRAPGGVRSPDAQLASWRLSFENGVSSRTICAKAFGLPASTSPCSSWRASPQ